MSIMYSPLEKSIELLEKDKSGNPYIALSLINLKSHKRNELSKGNKPYSTSFRNLYHRKSGSFKGLEPNPRKRDYVRLILLP